MPFLKEQISSPLEAGTSILDCQSLPAQVTEALEYTSRRLSRKALHITLVAVRKEYQLPSSTLPCAIVSPTTSTPASPGLQLKPTSPLRFTYPTTAWRKFVRRENTNEVSFESPASAVSFASSVPSPYTSSSSAVSSPGFSPRSAEIQGLNTPFLNSGAATPCTPLTPYTPCSVATTATTTTAASVTSNNPSFVASGPSPLGIRLIYTSPLAPRAERVLRATISRAERKFRLGPGVLPPMMSAAACGLSSDLIKHSIRQNEVLFSSEGLTLLGLDRLYAFKTALAAYARTMLLQSPPRRARVDQQDGSGGTAADTTRLEDAVDELRRLMLVGGGRRHQQQQPLARADLYRTYPWIGVSAGALSDVEGMYRRAYGGPEQIGAFELGSVTGGSAEERKAKLPAKSASSLFLSPLPSPTTLHVPLKLGTPPGSPHGKGPALKLQTTFDKPLMAAPKSRAKKAKKAVAAAPGAGASDVVELQIRIEAYDGEEEDAEGGEDDDCEDGDLTARPMCCSTSGGGIHHGLPFRSGLAAPASIDEMLQAQKLQPRKDLGGPVSPLAAASRSSQMSRLGPITPNGYDDISPITRGEWGFLFSGDGWKAGKKAAVVETW
ncbi:hypothetical protein BX600DRAFT_509105 [Xylariales sp. PMI_506]|nr:hypothetical protein BX600DRAFT_509105 [Xylariales sp. PMI_506]